MQSPKAIVFDLGKVLVDFDYTIAGRKIAAHCKKSLPEIIAAIAQSRFIVDYESGQLTRREFFDQARHVTGFSGTLEEFGDYFADIFTEIPAMVALHTELRQRGLPTYIFSNTNDLAVEHIRRNFPFFRQFDGYILSYEIGALKPEAKIYVALEQLAGCEGAQILYIDDRPENVAAGAARGWRTILQQTPEQTRRVIAAAGLL